MTFIQGRILNHHLPRFSLTNLPVDSPELDVSLIHSTAKFNAENNESFYFKTDAVKSVTVQVVTGTKFSIEFLARETKKSSEELTKVVRPINLENSRVKR